MKRVAKGLMIFSNEIQQSAGEFIIMLVIGLIVLIPFSILLVWTQLLFEKYVILNDDEKENIE